MAEITFEQSLREIERFQEQAAAAEKEQNWTGAVAAYQEMLRHPCAHHQVVAYEVWDDIHQLHRRAGDFDAAIDAKRAAIAAGYRSEPDPEADIAECHLLAGEFPAAARLYAALREKTPDDPWLYNSAGWAYAQVGAGPTSSTISPPTIPLTSAPSKPGSSASSAGVQPLSVAPLSVDELLAFSQEQELDPGSAEARSAYAAQLSRTGRSRPWPPGRNEPCWCGSARKYKHCCGPVPAAGGGE